MLSGLVNFILGTKQLTQTYALVIMGVDGVMYDWPVKSLLFTLSLYLMLFFFGNENCILIGQWIRGFRDLCLLLECISLCVLKTL